MTGDGPCYFPDFRNVFNACGSVDHARTLWKRHSSALEQGISLYKPRNCAALVNGSNVLTLVYSPADYDAGTGDHGAALALVSKHLELHESQALLLLKRWVCSTKAKLTPGWTPTDEDLSSLRQLYASQRWHHLLCMRYAAEFCASQSTGLSSGSPAVASSAINTLPVSPDVMLPTLLEAIGHAMESRTPTRLRTVGRRGRSRHSSLTGDDCGDGRDASDHLASELCLMLQTVLYLCPVTAIDLSSVLESVKQINDGVGQSGQSAWHDHGTVRGLVPRYAVAVILHLLQCRETVEAFESPDMCRGTAADIDALMALSSQYLDSPLSDTPALAPCMLACAAQLLGKHAGMSTDTNETCRKLVLVAEACSPILAVTELLNHESLKEERPGVFADAVFYTIGTWCHIFSLRPSAMEMEVLYQFLAMMGELLHNTDGGLATMAWSALPGTKFVEGLIRDGSSIFPVFPIAYATFLASLCTGRDTREYTWQALQDLDSFTAYLDEETQKALKFCDSEVTIRDSGCTALQRVVLQVAPVRQLGRVIPMPELANLLNVGNGCLVQWELQDHHRPGLGFVLMIEEIMDRSEKLQMVLSQHGDLVVLEHIVHTLAACTSLIARLLHHDPWRIFDLLHRRVAGSDVAGYALCSAAHTTLSVIGLHPSVLLERARGPSDLLGVLGATAGSCLQILSSVSLMLPVAVLQMLTAEGNGDLSVPGQGPIWLISMLEGVHLLENAWGKYPASIASVKLVESLLKCMGLTDDLLMIVIKVISGMGCYHTQWHLQDNTHSWNMTIAMLSMLHSAMSCSSLNTCNEDNGGNRSVLLNSLLHDGLLLRLFWANMPEPQVPRAAPEFFSILPGYHMHAVGLSMQCVIRMVSLALDKTQDLISALYQFLFTEQGGGWSVAATLNSYATEIYNEGGKVHGIPLQYMSSLMLLVRYARDNISEIVPAASFTSLMAVPGEALASGIKHMAMMRQIFVVPLSLEQCMQDRNTAATAAVAVATCLADHPSCGKLLIEPHRLKSDLQVNKEFNSVEVPVKDSSPESLLDVLWASMQSIAAPRFFFGKDDGVACVVPLLQTLSTIIGSGSPAGTILVSQPGFWQHLQAIWEAVTTDMGGSPDGSHNNACIGAATAIVNIVNFVLHQHWHQPRQRLDAVGELPIVCKGSDCFSLSHGGNASIFPSARIPAALITLFEKVCSTSSSTGNWLHGCLEQWSPKHVHNVLKEGEVALIKATQAAALLISTFLDSSIPAELGCHALKLWQDLSKCFAELHAASNGISADQVNAKKLSLLESLLGLPPASDTSHGIKDDEFECIVTQSRCHLPILSRLYGLSADGTASTVVDSTRWLLLAEDLHMLELSSNTFHSDACHRIYHLIQQALLPIQMGATVSVLLSAYARLLMVAMSHDEGVQVAKACLGESVQLTLIQQAACAWDICIACSISDSQEKSVVHGLRPKGVRQAISKYAASPAISGWMPVRMTPWGLASVHLVHARSLLDLANLAVMTERTSAGRSAGIPHLRREPSFAQLAGSSAKVGSAVPNQALCAVLKACKDILPHVGLLQSRIRSSVARPAIVPAATMDESLSTFLHMVLEALAVRQGAIVTALRSPKQGAGASSCADVSDLVLDVTRALCHCALRDSSNNSARAMSILLGLVSTIGRADPTSPHATAEDIVSAVPLTQVLAAATQSIESVSGAEALHAELNRSQYPAAALVLVQQLAMYASLSGSSPSVEIFSQLLRFHAALGPADHTNAIVHLSLPCEFHRLVPNQLHQGVTNQSAGLGSRNSTFFYPVEKNNTIGPRGGVMAAHQAKGQGPTIQLGGKDTLAPDRRSVPHQTTAAGYTSSGQRLLSVLMQAQILRVLALLLSIPKPPEPVLVTLFSSQLVHLHECADAFCDLFFAEPSGEPFRLTQALIDELLACLDLWYVLGAHKGLLLLSTPAALTQLQNALCRVLDTVALLPLEQSAIARLSTAPVDPAEAKLAEEPTTDTSEALLGLQHFWFWVCSVCRSGPCSVEAVAMPAWARKSSSKTPRQGSKHMTSSPEYFRGTAGSRSYSPSRIQRDSLSPGPLSPAPGRAASRSPSSSPVTSLVQHTAFVSGAIPTLGDDIESTRHSEQLAIGVYQIARAAVRVLSVLEPQREAGEVDTSGSERWLRMNTALSLQRQCFELSRRLDRNQGDRSVDDIARRKMQDGLVCSLVDVLDYSSQVVHEQSHARSESSTKSQALPASHWRHVSTSRTILCRLVDN